MPNLIFDKPDDMDVSECESYIPISSTVIIHDKHDANDVANRQLVDDATVCVDVAMVHSTQSDLVTLDILLSHR